MAVRTVSSNRFLKAIRKVAPQRNPVAPPTPRTIIVDVLTDELRLTDWAVFRTFAEYSEATIHEVRR